MGLDVKDGHWVVKCDHCDATETCIGSATRMTKVDARKQAYQKHYELVRTSKGSHYVYDDAFCAGCAAEI